MPCDCTDSEVIRYRRRLSGPVLDRIALHVELGPVSADEALLGPPAESSAEVRARVVKARRRQLARQTVANALLSPAQLADVVDLNGSTAGLLRSAVKEHHLTGRATAGVLRVARSIADLVGASSVREPHVAEALSFRCSGSRL